MSLADSLATQATTSSQGPRCPIARAFAILPPEDAEVLRTALDDRDRFTGKMIANALTEQGVGAGESGVQRHRRGACMCP